MATASLHLCQVLEEEFEALHGELPYKRTWLVTAADLRDPPRLGERLRELFPDRFHEGSTLVPDINSLLNELSGQKRSLLLDDRIRQLVGARIEILVRDFASLDDQSRLHVNRVILDRLCEGLLENVHEVRLRQVYDALHEEQVSALCLSGGGIRSATFGLGVLQGLARHRVLDKFHYLSTVSGGGYIGAWFSSWIRRHEEGVRGVADDLHPGPRSKEAAEEKPVEHLREYSNYLTPRLGLLSADTWTLIAIYLRNLLLNWLVLLPLLMILIILPWLLNGIVLMTPPPMLWQAEWVGLAFFAVSLAYIGFNRPLTRERRARGARETTLFLLLFLAPLIISAGSALAGWAWYTSKTGQLTPSAFFAAQPMRWFLRAVVAVPIVSWVIYWLRFLATDPYERSDPRDRNVRTIAARAATELFAALASGSIMAALMAGFALTAFRHPTDPSVTYRSELYVCFGVPLMLLALFIQAAIFIGGSSRVNEDYDREWWSRAGAWMLTAAAVWIVVTGVSIFGPLLIFAAPRLLPSIGGLSGLIALLIGKSAKTAATRKEKEQGGPMAQLTNLALSLTAPVFALFILAVISLGLTRTIHATLPLLQDNVSKAVFTETFRSRFDAFGAGGDAAEVAASMLWQLGLGNPSTWSVRGLDPGQTIHVAVIHGLHPSVLLRLLVLLLLVEALAPLLIDVNKFSMHSMYRNRLIRAYLGASRYSRRPNPFTGFDPQDNLGMASLRGELFFASRAFRNIDRFLEELRSPERCEGEVRRKVAQFVAARLSGQTKKLLRRLAPAADIVVPLFLDLNHIMTSFDLAHLEAEPVPKRRTLERFRVFTLEVLGIDGVPRRDPMRVRRNRRLLEKVFPDCIYPFDMPRVNRCDVADAAAIIRAIVNAAHELAHEPALSREEVLHRINDELTEAERATLADANAHAPYVRDRVADCIVAALNRVIQKVDLNDRAHDGPYDQQTIRRNRLRLDAIFDGALSPITLPRPLHVVNAALNLVGGENLAWQERKAEPFTITPLHCGSRLIGYRDTNEYGGADGVSLGTAVTISGAAASPNMGYHSSPAMAFILTMFNVRLGWWLGNPGPAGQKSYGDASPRHSLWPMFAEAAGATNDRADYVYLSDGGHFENLGLYEMVLRRCHWIVLSDAGCDPTCAFDDLGNAIRKIRTDLGIEIELRRMFIYPRAEEKLGKYCAVGRIRYDAVDPGKPDGVLIYLKPAVYGGEPKDVFNYSKQNEAFPHESTVDQFFSESQFESYRMLGSHAIDQILGPIDAPAALLEEMVSRAVQYSEMTPNVQAETRDVLKRFLSLP